MAQRHRLSTDCLRRNGEADENGFLGAGESSGWDVYAEVDEGRSPREGSGDLIMDTGLPRKRAVKKESREPTNEIVSKYFLPFAAAITSAIFYFAGWVYVAHWYGFFGIDATQINIPTQVILLHGVPGILVLGISLMLGVIFNWLTLQVVSIKPGNEAMPDAKSIDLSSTIIWALFFALIGMNFLANQVPDQTDNPEELIFSSVGLSVIFGIRLFQMFFLNSPSQTISKPTDSANYSVQGILLVIYFFVSITTSAILGEWDAARGGRLLIGNWRIPEVSLYSEKKIPVMAALEREINGNFEYSQLGLLSSDDHVYYLSDWKTTEYYTTKPKVYIIPRSDSLFLNFIISPYENPTETSLSTELETSTETP